MWELNLKASWGHQRPDEHRYQFYMGFRVIVSFQPGFSPNLGKSLDHPKPESLSNRTGAI